MSVSTEDKVILKRVFRLLKPYITKIGIIFVCIIASAGSNMLVPLLSRNIMHNRLLIGDFDM